MLSKVVSVSWREPIDKQQAQRVAAQLQLPCAAPDQVATPWLLQCTQQGLCLIAQQQTDWQPIMVVLDHARMRGYRQLNWRQHLIARAVGVKACFRPRVLDVTAGFAADAYTLYQLGCPLTLVERNPIIAMLVIEAVQRLAVPNSGMRLIQVDAIEYMQTHLLTDYDAIYIDPMYPERTKSALVKKEMRCLREIVGDDLDADSLLECALASNCRRIVVKRPKLAPLLANRQPSFVLKGRAVRFDVYQKQS